MRVLTVLLVFVSSLGLALCYQDKTVLQYLIDNGYSSFVQLLRETHQDTQLDGKGPFTVFAPSNAAISSLPADTISQLAHNPLQKKSLIRYHLVNAFILIPSLASFDHIDTTAGQRIDFVHIGHSVILNNNTRVDPPPNNDIICSNGIVQPIDHVLIPPLYSNDNIAAVLVERDDLFQEFILSLTLTNMTTIIENGEYTLFAPVNEAYAQFANNIFHPRFSAERRAQAFYEIIKYHLVPGARYSSMLQTGQKLFTLHGTPLNITVLNSGIVVDNAAHVVKADIPASNGVIHAIDHMLFPGDLLEQLKKEYYALHPTPSG